ncbi:ribosome small subunit-dependent GTPase A [Demequina muriae]|uniref:Small ribosomal subunit biogenesis GTPase RsgA n=1 Tax=Demequina muriae TaxID=3051664 RepID=A0ABT8GHX7_9MICO|nr:ribosome small subunit-dependent GTPase A [Demequina sp. EGI L300058]MDN4481038.1 ribosome small subunit-dependent GTPase A [Demequina sp. EGI L300058]
MRREYDESDARVRPGRRGSRPRSKIRPAHLDAVPGTVIGVDRGRLAVHMDDGVSLTAVKARELGRRGLVVGDRVGVVGDTSGQDGSLARIVRREPRATELRRTADDTDPTERVVVANAQQLAIVTSLADPEPNPRMIDRCLVAAFDAGMDALLVLTKGDLASADALRDSYDPLGVALLTTTMTTVGEDRTFTGLDELRERLQGRSTVLVGYSGVGKSTLVNAIVPEAHRTTGIVNDVTGRGRHTSTSAIAFDLPGGGRIIDTPGIRSFGLAHVNPEHFIAAFPDVAEAAAEGCPRGCTHESEEAGCALDAWASTPDQRARVVSIRRLLASRAEGDAW